MPRVAQPCVDGSDPCPCRYHAAVKARQRAVRNGGRRDQFNRWQRQHDALLLDRLDRGETPEEIAAALTARFAVPRTAVAVKLRATRLGRSLVEGWWSEAEIGRRLGLSARSLAALRADGRLEAVPYGRWLRYDVRRVEAFTRSWAGLALDPRRVRDPRLRAMAETAAIVNRRRQGA